MSKAELIAQGIKGSPQQSVLSNHYSFHLQSARYVMQKKTAQKIPKQTKPTLWYHLKCYHTTIFYKTLGDHSYRMKHFSNNKKVLNIINRFCMNTNSSITIPKEQATCWEKVPKNQSLFYSQPILPSARILQSYSASSHNWVRFNTFLHRA